MITPKNSSATFFPVPGTEALRDRVTAEMLATPQPVMLGAMVAMLDPEQPDWILQKVDAPVLVINARSPWWNSGYENYVRSLSPQVGIRRDGRRGPFSDAGETGGIQRRLAGNAAKV